MKKESKYKIYLEAIIIFVLLFGFFKISTGFEFIKDLKPDTSIEKIITIIGIILMAFVVLAVHELGHLVVGLINGFRFELFVVGSLGIKRENDKIKVYFNKNLAYYGGVAATSPIDDSHENPRKFAQVLLGGPIASLLFAVVCFVITHFVGKPFGVLFYAAGMISIAIFLATTIPSKTGMFFTDRKRYQRLVKAGKDREIEIAMLKIVGIYSRDNSYKNVDKDDIIILASDELPFIKFFGLFSLVCFELEKDGIIEENTLKEYESTSKEVSKSLAIAFDKELEKLKATLKIEDNKV